MNKTRNGDQRSYARGYTSQEGFSSRSKSKDGLRTRLGARVFSNKQSRRVLRDRSKFAWNIGDISNKSKIINEAYKKRLNNTSDMFSDKANYYN